MLELMFSRKEVLLKCETYITFACNAKIFATVFLVAFFFFFLLFAAFGRTGKSSFPLYFIEEISTLFHHHEISYE